MRLEARVDRLEGHTAREGAPGLMVVTEGPDGLLTTLPEGDPLDTTALDPRTLLVVIGERPDGPQ